MKEKMIKRKLLSFLLTLAMVMGLVPWISLPADAATAKEVAVNEPSLPENVKSANEASLPENVKRAKDGTLTYSEDGLGTGNFAEEAIEGGTVYRLYNPNSGEHFYTLSVVERDSVVKAGWNDEGVAYDASVKASDSDAAPVYRVYNPNAPADNSSHHYTCNAAEAQNLVSLGWRFEGVGFYVFPADRKNGMTVYREYNKNDGGHNYTTNKEEHDFLMEAGWADENTAWKVKDVQEVGTQKELEAVLATTSLTDLKIATNKKVELSIPEEDYALVDLVVDAPKASITNAGAFRSIDLRSIAADTWTEKGKNNNIVVNNTERVHIIVDALLNRLKSLIFNGKIDGVNTLEVLSGTVDELMVTAQDPIDVSLSANAEVGSVAVNAATNVNVVGKDSAAIGAAAVNTAGGSLDITLLDGSTLDGILVARSASSTEGVKTSLTVSAGDNSAVESIKVEAAGATLAVSASGKSTIGEIDVSKEASSTEDEKTNVTLSTEGDAAVGTVKMEAAGAALAVSASGKSTINEVTVAESASGADTNVEVKADGTAKIESVTTSAEDANVSVTSNGESTVGTVKLEGAAQATVDGDSSNTTTVDITGANKDAKAVVKKDSVEVETTPDTATSSIVTNDSGSSIPTSSKDSSDNETSGSIPPKDGGSGSEGGSEGGSGGSSGGSSGGGSGGSTPSTDTSVKVNEVSIDKTNPKVGDEITATVSGTNTSSATYKWYTADAADSSDWEQVSTAKTLAVTDAMFGKYIKLIVSGTSTSDEDVTTSPVAAKEGNSVITVNQPAKGGKISASANQATKGAEITLTATPAWGYKFTGWSVKDGESHDVEVTSNKFTMPASDVTVTAEFTAKTYTLKFGANGAIGTAPVSPNSFTIETDDLMAPAGTGLTNDGHAFLGWALNENDTKPDVIAGARLDAHQITALVYLAETNTTTADTVVVYAVWEAVATYTIRYYGNGTTTDVPELATFSNADSTKELASQGSMTRTGYTFAGWAFSQGATTQDYIGGASADVAALVAKAGTGNIVPLYAVWTPNTLTITYNLDGGKIGEATTLESKTVKYSESAALTDAELPAATKDGYTFDGWYYTKETEFDTKATTAYDVKAALKDNDATLALKAKYKENTYTIAFDKDGGTGTAESLTEKAASATLGTLPTEITKDGYAFKGWSLNGSTPAVTAETLVSAVAGSEASGSTITLKAIWTANKLTITYNLNGGKIGEATTKDNVEVEYANDAALTATELPDATQEGYTFGGWFTNPNDVQTKVDTTYNVKAAIANGNATLALTAKWALTSYSVTVATGIEYGTVTVDKATAHWGDKIIVTPTPAQGYKLKTLNYYDGKEDHTINSDTEGNIDGETTTTVYWFNMPAANVTVKATFEASKIQALTPDDVTVTGPLYVYYKTDIGVADILERKISDKIRTIEDNLHPEVSVDSTSLTYDLGAVTNATKVTEYKVTITDDEDPTDTITLTVADVEIGIVEREEVNIVSVEATAANKVVVTLDKTLSGVENAKDLFGINTDGEYGYVEISSVSVTAGGAYTLTLQDNLTSGQEYIVYLNNLPDAYKTGSTYMMTVTWTEPASNVTTLVLVEGASDAGWTLNENDKAIGAPFGATVWALENNTAGFDSTVQGYKVFHSGAEVTAETWGSTQGLDGNEALTTGDKVIVLAQDGKTIGTYTVTVAAAPKSTTPTFLGDTTKMMTDAGATAVEFTLKTIPNGTWKVYTKSEGVYTDVTNDLFASVDNTGATLTLTFNTAPTSDGTYYVTLTEAGKSESDKSDALTVQKYVAPPTKTPSFSSAIATLADKLAQSVTFTLKAAVDDSATWKVYDTETGTDESTRATVEVSGTILTLIAKDGNPALASGTYYVTAKVEPNAESERVPLTVKPAPSYLGISKNEKVAAVSATADLANLSTDPPTTITFTNPSTLYVFDTAGELYTSNSLSGFIVDGGYAVELTTDADGKLSGQIKKREFGNPGSGPAKIKWLEATITVTESTLAEGLNLTMTAEGADAGKTKLTITGEGEGEYKYYRIVDSAPTAMYKRTEVSVAGWIEYTAPTYVDVTAGKYIEAIGGNFYDDALAVATWGATVVEAEDIAAPATYNITGALNGTVPLKSGEKAPLTGVTVTKNEVAYANKSLKSHIIGTNETDITAIELSTGDGGVLEIKPTFGTLKTGPLFVEVLGGLLSLDIGGTEEVKGVGTVTWKKAEISLGNISVTDEKATITGLYDKVVEGECKFYLKADDMFYDPDTNMSLLKYDSSTKTLQGTDVSVEPNKTYYIICVREEGGYMNVVDFSNGVEATAQ